MVQQVFNLVGSLGVFLSLVAYFLLQFDKIKSSDRIYAFLNLFGAALILVSLYDAPNLPAIIMESAWGLISVYGLVKS